MQLRAVLGQETASAGFAAVLAIIAGGPMDGPSTARVSNRRGCRWGDNSLLFNSFALNFRAETLAFTVKLKLSRLTFALESFFAVNTTFSLFWLGLSSISAQCASSSHNNLCETLMPDTG